jgi:hypothetical protein
MVMALWLRLIKEKMIVYLERKNVKIGSQKSQPYTYVLGTWEIFQSNKEER